MSHKHFLIAVSNQIDRMINLGSELFYVEIDRDELSNLYLASFPDGTDPLYRARDDRHPARTYAANPGTRLRCRAVRVRLCRGRRADEVAGQLAALSHPGNASRHRGCWSFLNRVI